MSFLFDNDKSKVDFDAAITPKLNALKDTFQGYVNSMYNALVGKGKTPTAKTPIAISTAITNIFDEIYTKFVNQGTTPSAKTVTGISHAVDSLTTAKYNSGHTAGYNSGYSAAQSVTWTSMPLEIHVPRDNTVLVNYDARNMISFKCTGKSSGIEVNCYYFTSNNENIGTSNQISQNSTYTIPSNCYRIELIGEDQGGSGGTCTIQPTYKAKNSH